MDTKPNEMKMRRHMSVNIQGLLRNYGKKKINCIDHDDGTPMTDKEARAFLAICLYEGKRLLPMGDCDKFDYQKGCQGHEILQDDLTENL